MKERAAVVGKAREDAATINPKGGRPAKGETPTNGRRSVRRQGPNTKERILRRIARVSEKDPIAREALAAFETGEIATAAEAARAAGIKKPPKPEPPEAEAKRILAKAAKALAGGGISFALLQRALQRGFDLLGSRQGRGLLGRARRRQGRCEKGAMPLALRRRGAVAAIHTSTHFVEVLGAVCRDTHMDSREVIRALEADGWREVARKGSHAQFKHPSKPGRVTVPHPKRDLPVDTLKSIERQSGLRLR